MTRREFIADLMQKYPNITGASFGLKSVGGIVTREESIKITVAEKKPLSDIPQRERIPSAFVFDGVAFSTDVEVAEYKFLDNSVYPQGARETITIDTTLANRVTAGDSSISVSISDADADFISNSMTMLWNYPRQGVLIEIGGTNYHCDGITGSSGSYSLSTPFGFNTANSGDAVEITCKGATGDGSSYGFAPGIGIDTAGAIPNEQTGAIVGGAGMGNATSVPNAIGTLGFLAQDIETGAVVGVTNAHVAAGVEIGKMIEEGTDYTLGDALPQASVKDNFQWPFAFASQTTKIANQTKGMVWRVNQNINTTSDYTVERNQVDGAILFLNDGSFDGDSYKMFNSEVIGAYPEWCTDAELDGLVTNGNDLFSVGSRTGIKGTDDAVASGIRLKATNSSQSINLQVDAGINPQNFIAFNDVVSFSAFDSTDADYDFGDGDYGTPVPGASQGGDSGSAVFANIGGTWKLAGLLFSGAYPTGGSFCRITNVARELGIERWDGSTTAQPITGTPETIILGGQLTDPTVVVNGKTYYRAGYTTDTADTHYPTS